MKSQERDDQPITASEIEQRHRHTVNTLLRVSQPFGAAPFVVWPPDAASNRRSSWLRYLNLCYILIYMVIVSFAFYSQLVELDTDIPVSETIIFGARYVMYYVAFVLIVLGTQWHRFEYTYFVRKLTAIDVGLRNVRQSDNDEHRPMLNSARLRWLLHGAYATLSVSMIISAIVDFFFYDDMTVVPWLRSLIVYLISNVTTCLALFQMVTGLWLLHERYAAVNETMRRLLGDQSVWLVGVKRVRRLHLQLNVLYERVLGVFGPLMVCLVVGSVLDLTVQLYRLYVYALRSQAASNWTLAVYTVMWFCIHGGKMLLVLWSSDRTQMERDRNVRVVSEVALNITCGRNRAVNNQLLKIQMQAMHDREPAMACGIVQLNLSLVATILGSLTGLLVILIQFESSMA